MMILIETNAVSRYEVDKDYFWTVFGEEFEDSMGVSIETAGEKLKKSFISNLTFEHLSCMEEIGAREYYDDFNIEVTL